MALTCKKQNSFTAKKVAILNIYLNMKLCSIVLELGVNGVPNIIMCFNIIYSKRDEISITDRMFLVDDQGTTTLAYQSPLGLHSLAVRFKNEEAEFLGIGRNENL